MRPDFHLVHARSANSLRSALDGVAALSDPGAYVTWPPYPYRPHGAPNLVVKAQRALEAAAGNPDDALTLVSTSPEQARNRAALVIGFGAALTLSEALALRQGDIALTTSGLVINVPQRRNPISLPRDPGTVLDPLDAWEAWRAEMASWGLRDDSLPAWLNAFKNVVHPRAPSVEALHRMVRDPAAALGLSGSFTWQSLRWGAIRTAIRNNERRHHVAALANTNLNAVNRHYRRESMIKHSVAGQLGL